MLSKEAKIEESVFVNVQNKSSICCMMIIDFVMKERKQQRTERSSKSVSKVEEAMVEEEVTLAVVDIPVGAAMVVEGMVATLVAILIHLETMLLQMTTTMHIPPQDITTVETWRAVVA